MRTERSRLLKKAFLLTCRGDAYSYFTAARPSVSRHIYSISLPRSSADVEALRSGKAKNPEPTLLPGQLVKKGEKADLASYKISFSTSGGAYQLDYGPSDNGCAASRRIANLTLAFALQTGRAFLGKSCTKSKIRVRCSWLSFLSHGRSLTSPLSPADAPLILTDNAPLAERDASYLHADITHSRMVLEDAGAGTGDVEVNVMEIRPPMMDESGRTKYPVLFQVSVLASRQSLSLYTSDQIYVVYPQVRRAE